MLNFSNLQKCSYALFAKNEVFIGFENSYEQINYLFFTYKPQSYYKNQHEIGKAL